MEDTFIRTADVGKVLLEYIGSEDYLKAVESIQDSGKSAFMGGIGMAGCVIMARCHKYYAKSVDDETEAAGDPDGSDEFT